MADKKISQLTAASTPLAGTEVLPIVQSSATVKVAVSNLTAGRDVNASSFQVGTRLKMFSTYIADAASPTGNNTGLAFSNRIYPCDSAGTLTNNTLALGSGSYQFSTIYTGDNVVVGTAAKGINFTANTGAAGMTSQLLNWYEEGTWTGTLSAATPPTVAVTATGNYTRVGRQVTVNIQFSNVSTAGSSGTLQILNLPFTPAFDALGSCGKVNLSANVNVAYVANGNTSIRLVTQNGLGYENVVATTGVYLWVSITYFV